MHIFTPVGATDNSPSSDEAYCEKCNRNKKLVGCDERACLDETESEDGIVDVPFGYSGIWQNTGIVVAGWVFVRV